MGKQGGQSEPLLRHLAGAVGDLHNACPLPGLSCERVHMLDAVLSASPHLIYVFGRDGRFAYANPAGAQALGLDSVALIGRTPHELGLGPLAELMEAQGQIVFAQGRAVTGEVQLAGPEGRRDYEYEMAPLPSPEGVVDAVIANLRDVTDRKRMQEELAEERDFSAAILDTAAALVVVLDREGRIVRFNRACELLSGYSFSEVAGKHVWDFLIPPEEAPAVRGVFSDLSAGRFPLEYENHWVSRDGRQRLIRWSNTALLDDEGRVEYVIGTGIDVTERRQAEAERVRLLAEVESERAHAEALAAEAERRASELTTVFAALADALIVFDASGRAVRANPAAQAVFGFDPTGMDYPELIRRLAIRHRDGRPYTAEEMPVSAALRSATVQGWRFLITDGRGRTLTILAAASPLLDDGRVVGAVAIWHDVTERERLLREVRTRAAELDTIINSIPDGVIVYSTTGEILRINAAAEKILGYSPEQLRRPIAERLTALRIETPEGRPVPVDAVPAMRAVRGEPVLGEVLVLHPPTGATVWITTSAVPIRMPEERPLGAVVTFTDITGLHELQEQREDILRAVSHDLRNPLAVVQGQAELLLRALEQGAPAAQERQSVEAIRTSARRMNVMIQDLVDSARLETGQLQLSRQPLDLGAFLADLKERLRSALDMARVTMQVPPGLPPAWADPDRLERIMVNLLSNALKYSTPGTPVTVGVARRDGELAVSVTDIGPAIAPEELPHLFSRYYRAQAGRERHDSLGLGLYITRMLVEAHGGHIWVESTPAETTFSFTLPEATQFLPPTLSSRQ